MGRKLKLKSKTVCRIKVGDDDQALFFLPPNKGEHTIVVPLGMLSVEAVDFTIFTHQGFAFTGEVKQGSVVSPERLLFRIQLATIKGTFVDPFHLVWVPPSNRKWWSGFRTLVLDFRLRVLPAPAQNRA